MKIKVFVPDCDYKLSRTIEIFDYATDGKIKIADSARSYFELIEQISDADWVLIPVFLSSMTAPSKQAFIQKSCSEAAQHNIPFGVFSNSDIIIDPGVEHAFIFTPGAYASMKGQVEIPAVLSEDPIEKWEKAVWTPIEREGERPTLGFCGQATRNPLKLVKDMLTIESIRYHKTRKRSVYLHVPRFYPAFERGRLLHYLERSKRIDADFILRTHYKGGASSADQKESVEKEFYENIYSNLFTLCLRGMGNYSVRFYQTLAMGRIPVLIDTDSVLPFSSRIDYSNVLVRVPFSDRFNADKYILEFMVGKTKNELVTIQRTCREIWLQNFRKDGLIHNLAAEMKHLKESNPR